MILVTTGHTIAATAFGTIVGLIVGVIWSPRVKATLTAEEARLKALDQQIKAKTGV